MESARIPVQLAAATGMVPAYAHQGDAGFDLHSVEDCVLHPFERRLIHTGISLAIPEGYAGLVIPRSGLAAKHGISIVNAPGLVDSGYRGEICVILVNLDPVESFQVHAGDRIAQMMITPYVHVEFQQVPELSSTDRGSGGFGSSGV